MNHVSRVSTKSLAEAKDTVSSSGRLRTADQCESRRPRTAQIQSRWSKTWQSEWTQRTCICEHERIAVSWSLTEAQIENTSNSNWVNFCASGAFPRKGAIWTTLERKLDWTSSNYCSSTTEPRKHGWNCSVCAQHSLYRAASEHSRPATTREMFLHQVYSANLLPSQFEQVLQNRQVPDGVSTDLVDPDRPPAEAVERPEDTELNWEGRCEQDPRKRIQIKSKNTACSRFRKRKTTSHGDNFTDNRN